MAVSYSLMSSEEMKLLMKVERTWASPIGLVLHPEFFTIDDCELGSQCLETCCRVKPPDRDPFEAPIHFRTTHLNIPDPAVDPRNRWPIAAILPKTDEEAVPLGTQILVNQETMQKVGMVSTSGKNPFEPYGKLKVYLDDERETPNGWRRVYWPDEAIKLLEAGQVIEISLDHDLGDDERGTGYDVVLWIEEAVATRDFVPPGMSVHSANSSAREKMERGIAAIKAIHASNQNKTS